jgi:hypothetical protein
MDIKSKNTFGIQFVLRLPKNKKDEMATVYTRITVNGRRTEISVKSKVSGNNWDEVKGRAKGKRPEIPPISFDKLFELWIHRCFCPSIPELC